LCSGVYLFEHIKLGTQYIGSATNFGDRLRVHHKEMTNPKTYFYKYVVDHGEFSSFKWGPIYQTTNFLREFRILNPYYKLSKGEVIILTHLTQLEVRTLEQSLLLKYKPSLNSEYNVYFPILSWDPSLLNNKWEGTHLGNKIEIWSNSTNIEGIHLESINTPLIIYNSTLEASRQLGISRHKLMRYLNHNTPAYSPSLDISVIIKYPNSILSTEQVKSHRLKHRPIQDVNLDLLKVGRLYAYLPDKKTVHSEYSTTGEAALALNPQKFNNKTTENRFILRYINQDKLVKTELGTFYFMSHPNTLKHWSNKVLPQPIYVIDIKEGTALL
jgi:GIY-YIG catalytic domain